MLAAARRKLVSFGYECTNLVGPGKRCRLSIGPSVTSSGGRCVGQVSGAQRGRERHAAPTADAHGGRLAARAQPPRPLPLPRPAEAMELADVPRHRPLAFDKVSIPLYLFMYCLIYRKQNLFINYSIIIIKQLIVTFVNISCLLKRNFSSIRLPTVSSMMSK